MTDKADLKRDEAVDYLTIELPGLEFVKDGRAGDLNFFGYGCLIAIDGPYTKLEMPDKYSLYLLGKQRIISLNPLPSQVISEGIAEDFFGFFKSLGFDPFRNFNIETARIETINPLGLYEGTPENLKALYQKIYSVGFKPHDEFIVWLKDPPLFMYAGKEIELKNPGESKAFIGEIIDGTKKLVKLQEEYPFSQDEYITALKKCIDFGICVFPEKPRLQQRGIFDIIEV